MVEKHTNVAGELQHLQNSIATLFQGLINETNKYKYEKEKSVECLLEELNSLRKENENLRKSKAVLTFPLASPCENCIGLRKRLVIMDEKWKKFKKKMKPLREFIYEAPYKNMSLLNFSKLLILQLDELNSDDSLDNEIMYLEKINLFSGSTSSSENNSGKSDCYNSMKSIKNSCEGTYPSSEENKKSEVLAKLVEQKKLNKNVQSDSIEINGHPECKESKLLSGSEWFGFSTPKKVDKARSSSSNDGCKNQSLNKSEVSPILPIDQRSLTEKNFVSVSPTYLSKRKAGTTRGISPIKIIEKQINRKSLKQRKYSSPAKGSLTKPYAQLRVMNSLEAEISVTGIRKLKQTQLNFEFYKKKDRQESNDEQIEDKSRQVTNVSKFGEDDLIFESPKSSEKFLGDFKKNSQEQDTYDDTNSGLNLENTLDIDPEETCINSLYLKHDENVNNKNELVSEVTPNLEGSPEYNTVHFPFKDDPVRKKSERMRLPGQMCVECNKYYKAVLGEMDSKELQEILDRCSRHRDKHCNIVDTPPGYWKPYLTASLDVTAEEDNTHFEI